MEIQRAFFRKRALAIDQGKAIAVTKGTFSVWNLRGYAADLTAMIPLLLAGIGQQRFSLIAVDPIYKVLGLRDENAAGDITRLMNELERLAVQTVAAVVFGAHFSKGNQAAKDPMDRIGGSGVYARDPDSLLTLTRHEEDDAFTVDMTLRNLKQPAPFVVRWQYPLMLRATSLDPAKIKQIGGRQKLHDATQLADLLGDQNMTHGEWLSAAKEHAGMSKGTFTTLRKELMNTGRVHQSKVTQKYEQVRKVK